MDPVLASCTVLCAHRQSWRTEPGRPPSGVPAADNRSSAASSSRSAWRFGPSRPGLLLQQIPRPSGCRIQTQQTARASPLRCSQIFGPLPTALGAPWLTSRVDGKPDWSPRSPAHSERRTGNPHPGAWRGNYEPARTWRAEAPRRTGTSTAGRRLPYRIGVPCLRGGYCRPPPPCLNFDGKRSHPQPLQRLPRRLHYSVGAQQKIDHLWVCPEQLATLHVNRHGIFLLRRNWSKA